MANEDTELSFVRCPTCRSLIPAIAKRCRMCGHAFGDEEASSNEKASEEPTGKRIRHRTKTNYHDLNKEGTKGVITSTEADESANLSKDAKPLS